MSDQVLFSLREVVAMIEERVFFRIAQISIEDRFQRTVPSGKVACRGGAAIGVKTKGGKITLSVSEINSDFHDYWEDESGRYAAYAAMKVVTALQSETPTTDTGAEFSFSGAVHRGAVPAYLEQYKAWIAISFSGFKSSQDEEIAVQALKEFFENKE